MDRFIHRQALGIRSNRRDDTHTIELLGELDLAGYATTDEELRRVESTDAKEIVLDLSKLTFIDSTGITLLLEAHARSRSDGGRLTMVPGERQVERVLELTGVDSVLPFSKAAGEAHLDPNSAIG